MATHIIEVIQRSKNLPVPVAKKLKTYEFDDETEDVRAKIKEACDFADDEYYKHSSTRNDHEEIIVLDTTNKMLEFTAPY